MRPHAHKTDVSALLGVRLETGKAGGRAYTAFPNLANVRWLLPAKQPALRRGGTRGLHKPGSLRGQGAAALPDPRDRPRAPPGDPARFAPGGYTRAVPAG